MPSRASVGPSRRVTTRKIPTLSVTGGARGGRKASRGSIACDWLDGPELAKVAMLDPDTAQVTPLELTQRLMEEAVAKGARLRIGVVEGLALEGGQGDSPRRVAGVCVDGHVVPARKVVVAMGPWSVLVEDWLGDCPVPMEGVKSTSLVYHTAERDDARVMDQPFALFCAEDTNGCHLEVYPRPNGDVYICGCGGSDYVRGARLRAQGDCGDPRDVDQDPKRTSAASASFQGLSTVGNAPPDVAQACMRPCPEDGLPIMGPVPTCQGLYMATGHNCWGILWAPVTGKAMAELLVDGKASVVDLSAFTPSRFMAKPKQGRGKKQGQLAVGEQW
eukprot:jgi/Mesvir1/28629/Mv04497-RA.2